MLDLIHEVLRHGDAGVRCEVLQRRALGSRRGDDDGVLHGAVLFERLDDARDRRSLLADGDVDADAVLALLVQDRIDRDGRFADAAVADDELALAAADRHEGVDGLDARLQRLLDRLAVSDARRMELDRTRLRRLDGALAVDGAAECVDDAADHVLADRHLHDAARALDLVAFFDFRVAAEDNGADVVLLKVQDQTINIMTEIEQLAGHGLVEAMDMRDAVADFDDGSDIIDVQIDIVVLDLILDDGGDFLRIHFHT